MNDRTLGKRLLLGHLAVAIVMVLSAATALVALGSTIRRVEGSTEVQDRLGRIAEIRADAREMAMSARRYLLTGNRQEQQRVYAIEAALGDKRDALWMRSPSPSNWVVELDKYATALTTAMSRDHGDIVALSRFEDDLKRAGNTLDVTLDAIVAQERARLEQMRTSMSLTRGARWTLIAASVFGLVILVVNAFASLRLLARRRGLPPNGPTPGTSAQACDVVSLIDRVTHTYRSPRPYGQPRIRYEARLGLAVNADADRIERVLTTLIEYADSEARIASEIVIYTAARLGHIRVTVRCEIVPQSALPNESDLRECRRTLAEHGGKCGVDQRGDLRAYWFTLPTVPSISA